MSKTEGKCEEMKPRLYVTDELFRHFLCDGAHCYKLVRINIHAAFHRPDFETRVFCRHFPTITYEAADANFAWPLGKRRRNLTLTQLQTSQP